MTTEAETLTLLKTHMKEAMRAKERERLGTIRMVLASLKNKQIELRRELDEADILTVLSTEAKRRREAADAYRDGGRDELADKEEAELLVLATYLPEPMNDDDVLAIIDEAIASTGAQTRRDMGRNMGVLMPRIKGRSDGKRAKDLVLEKLS